MWQTRSSYLARPERTRARLFPPFQLIAFASLMLIVLLMFFYQQHLAERVRIDRRADDVTLIYLRNLLRADPADVELRLHLAGVHARRGQLDQARAELRPLLGRTPERAALRLDFDLAERQVYGLRPGSPERAAGLERLRRQLEAMAPHLQRADEWIWLAAKAQAQGQPTLVLAAYRHLARIDTAHAAQWQLKAARALQAAGLSRPAAGEYFAALEKSADPAERRRLYRAGVDAWLAADRPALALEAAVKYQPLIGEDRETLLYIVRLARAANRPDVAEIYVKRLLRLSLLLQLDAPRWRTVADDGTIRPPAAPDMATPGPGLAFDEEVYALSYDVFLSNRNLKDAYRVAASAVRQRPGDPRWRERLARVAEWSQQPEVALEQWRWLARSRGGRDDWANYERLASATQDAASRREILERKAAGGTLDDAGWQALVAAYEALAQPERAVDLLRRHGGDAPVRRRLLAGVLERSGRLEEALEILVRLAPDAPPAEVARIARLLAAQDREDDALRLLLEQSGRAAATEADYWTLLADIAWRTGRTDAASNAYGRLLPHADTSLPFERYYLLTREAAPDKALAAARAGWERLREPRLLLLALSLLGQRRDWRGIAELSDALDAETLTALQRESGFWLLRAEARSRLGRAVEARADMRRALALEPDSTDLLQAYVWMLIGQGDARELRRELPRLEARAAAPAHWEAALAGRLRLDQPRAARAWLERLLRERPSPERLMTLADLLQQLGQTEFAARIQRRLALGTPVPRALPRTESGWSGFRAWINHAGADRVHAAWRALAPAAGASEQAGELLLSSLFDRGEYARVERALRRLPAGAGSARTRSALAVVSGDVQRQEALLRAPAALPEDDRIAALRQLGRGDEALSLLFERQSARPGDDAAARQWPEAAWGRSRRGWLRVGRGEIGALRRTQTLAGWSGPAMRDLRLDGELRRYDQTATDRLLGRVDGTRTDLRFGLDGALSGRARWHLDLWRAEARGTRWGQSLTFELPLPAALALAARWEREVPNTEQDALAAWATASGPTLTLSARPDRRDALILSWEQRRFRDHAGTPLSSLRRARVDWTHIWLGGKPDLNTRLSLVDQRGIARGAPAVWRGETTDPAAIERFAASDDTAVELTATTGGDYYARPYNHWLPIALLGLRYSLRHGWSYQAGIGVSQSLTGADHLTLRYATSIAREVGRGGQEFWLEYHAAY